MLRKIPTLLIILFIASLSACQGDAPSTNITVELSDFAITPNRLIVPAGSEITIHVTNSGSIMHDLTIMKLGVDVGDKFDVEDQDNIYWEMEIQTGETETVQFLAPDQPGVYQIVCRMPGHLQAGMFGTLEVVE
ncbi:MAG: cupredoxin domain-containing protein [Chloroflexi bacterium]|nr:cupredoxin domain-containing protein [Chloroflexota bacterium]